MKITLENLLKNSDSNYWSGSIFLYTLYFIPPIINVLFDMGSLSYGIILTNIALFSLFRFQSIPMNIRSVMFSIIIFLILILSSLFYTSFSFHHVFSALGAAVFVLSASDFARTLESTSSQVITKAVITFFLVIIVIAILGIIFRGFIPHYAGHRVSVFPFQEPSHFAISASALFLYSVTVIKTGALWRILIFFGLSLFLPSLILLVVTIIGALIFVGKQRWYYVLPSFIFIGAAFSYFILIYADLSYFVTRIGFQSENLSFLVFQQGWSDLFAVLRSTDFLGLGFQNYASRPVDDAAAYIYEIAGKELNRSDGSFLMSKVGGEFGLLGLLFYMVLSVIIIRQLYIEKKHGGFAPFLGCITIAFFIEFTLRGVGYFTFTQFLFLGAAIFSLRRRHRV